MRNLRQPRAVITCEKIIKAAGALFALKGYHNTTLEAVRRKAEVSTGAFFHHFSGKEDLGFAVLKRHMEKRRQEIDRLEQGMVLAPDANPLSRLFRRLDAIALMINNRKLLQGGCVIGNLSASLSDTHEPFRKRLAECFAEMAAEFRPFLEWALPPAAQERLQLNMNARTRFAGDVEPVDAVGLSHYIVAVIQGTILLARAQRDTRLVGLGFENLKRYLHQVCLE